MESTDPASPSTLNACWSHIGTWGRRDCPELSKHVHCRNCPTYSEAAARMLDGPIPEGYLEAWSRHFAQAKAELPRDAETTVLFRIHHEWFGLPVAVLMEVVERRPIHSLPHARSPALLGVVNIRGQLLICVSLARILRTTDAPSGAPADQTNPERFLIVRTTEGPIVFPVSEVFGVCQYRTGELRTVPATVARSGGHFTRAMLPWARAQVADAQREPEEELVGLLDDQTLFSTVNRGLT